MRAVPESEPVGPFTYGDTGILPMPTVFEVARALVPTPERSGLSKRHCGTGILPVPLKGPKASFHRLKSPLR